MNSYYAKDNRPVRAGFIEWAGVDMRTVAGERVFVEHYPNFPRAARKIETESVPGRNGEVIYVQDAWENYDQEYEIVSGMAGYEKATPYKGIADNDFIDIAEWLFKPSGYQKLKDTYNEGIFRLAYFKGPFDVENILSQFGRATITFNCRPERFLDEGDVQTVYHNGPSFTAYNTTYPNGYTVSPTSHAQAYVNTGSGDGNEVKQFTVYNPTPFNAKPYILVYGSKQNQAARVVIQNGEEGVGARTNIRISEVYDYMRIDCDTMNVYRSSNQNRNSLVTITTSIPDEDGNRETMDFPVLTPGKNTIFWRGSGIQGLAVKPRWWTL